MAETDITYFNTISLVVSFLGGGIISALINWIRIEKAEKKERKIEFLEKQIQKLYGPLYYLILQNEKLFELNDKLDKAYDKEYIEKQWSLEKDTQNAIGQEASQTIGIKNEYIEIVTKNNIKIRELLDQQYVFIDQNDIETAMLFFEHHIRLTTETDEKGKLKIPLNIYNHVGNISFLRPEVINRFKEKFSNKKVELDKLLKNKSLTKQSS
jgi:hypothetical protein